MTRPPTISPMFVETSASMSIGVPPGLVNRVYRPPITGRPSQTLCYPSAAMAKRTRYPSRTKTRPAVKRVTQPEANAAIPNVLRGPSVLDAPDLLDSPSVPNDEMPVRSSSSLTETEFHRAEQLEAELVAKEREAIAESLRRRSRGEEQAVGRPADHNAPLSVRAAHEYAYVARDVKRIAATAGLMIGILAVLYILTNVLGVITL